MAVAVEASLRAEADRLRVSYRASNTGPDPAWLLDDMVIPDHADRLVRTPAAMIVVEAEDPEVVRLARGLVQPESYVAFPLIPGARRLEAGATLEGQGEVPLPLQAYHPLDGTRPLRRRPRRAVVELGVIEAPDPALEELPLAEGGTLTAPTPRAAMRHQRMVRSAVLELPGAQAVD